ncbi:MAG: lysophospholipid acyltransferase family protein [Luteolibacter sp.]
MLEFSDAPYRFFAPRPSPSLIRLGRTLNRHFILPGPNHRIREVWVDGALDALQEARRNGHRILFAINHPSHSDPQVVSEIQRRLGIPSCFIAAYDVFLRGKFTAWGMSRMGNFSIDREGADRKAMATAIQILARGERALNIFPEGNVYLTNDRVTPFLDGAAFIALKAQTASDTPVKIIPLSLKFSHLTTPREAITRRMLKLGADCGYRFPPGSAANPLDAVLGLGRHILGQYLEKHGLDGEVPSDDPSLFHVLENFAGNLVSRVENGLEITTAGEPPLVSRIAKARAKIHQLRTDPDAAPHPEINGLAERAILALRIHGYLTPYLTERPTIDRYDETVERIAEDFYSRNMPRTGPRRAMARMGEPIDVQAFSSSKPRDAIAALTREMEQRVQHGIDALNLNNPAPGRDPVDMPNSAI